MGSRVIDRWSTRDHTGYWTGYLLKLVRCGKKKCKGNRLHGPYVYMRTWDPNSKGRLRQVEKYVGKVGSEAVRKSGYATAGMLEYVDLDPATKED